MNGLTPTAADVEMISGQTARDLNAVMLRVRLLADWLSGKTQLDLEALGIPAQRATDILSAFGELSQLEAIYRGDAALAVAKDFTTFPSRFWGFGYQQVT